MGRVVYGNSVIISLTQFYTDFDLRIEDRKARAWGVLSDREPEDCQDNPYRDSGKKSALEYLNGYDGIFCNTWLSDACISTWKDPTALKRLDLSCAFLDGVVLPSAKLTGSAMRYASLISADLSGSNLTATRLGGAHLAHSNLTDVDLTGAILSGANLLNADLKDANLTGADLSRALMYNVKNLIQEQLNEACGDEHTDLPNDLTIETCEKYKM